VLCFFFSSRRRHTSFSRDWSSDVCSSDLYGPQQLPAYAAGQDPAGLYVRYAARDVVYLLGSADTNPEDHGLDKRCGAEAQGATQIGRASCRERVETTVVGASGRKDRQPSG